MFTTYSVQEPTGQKILKACEKGQELTKDRKWQKLWQRAENGKDKKAAMVWKWQNPQTGKGQEICNGLEVVRVIIGRTLPPPLLSEYFGSVSA